MIKILFTIREGGNWKPLFLNSLTRDDLNDALPNGDEFSIIREGNLTTLKGARIASVIHPNKWKIWSVIFHSIMFEDGNVFDSELARQCVQKGWDNDFYTAKDFNRIWKEEGIIEHKKWLDRLDKKRKEKKQ